MHDTFWHWMVLPLTMMTLSSVCEERQLTYTPKNHYLDNNDNFSPDERFLCYDTRETVGPGIDNGQTIEIVDIASGKETVLYAPKTMIGVRAAPGVGAASYSPVENKVVFIHGPPLGEVAQRGYYGKTNRVGAEVSAQGGGKITLLDKRDVATDRDTMPGAQRGGTHRHEYSLDGKRIGFTYDDFLLTQYGRTIGYMEPHPKAPEGATHYLALLVPVVPEGTSKPGEIEYAASDSWVGRDGTMRAFIGKVRADDGLSYEDSLFVIDLPENVDITTADAGSSSRFPSPPEGVTIRRLTHTRAQGIVRGASDGNRIAYYAQAADGTTQVFIIDSDGSDRHAEAKKRPIQATSFPHGAGPGLRWHPSGNSIACASNGGVAVTCVKPGPLFGKSIFLTPQGDGERLYLVWSPSGHVLAYNKYIPLFDEDGTRLHTYNGRDFLQIFTINFPDANNDGIADAIVRAQ